MWREVLSLRARALLVAGAACMAVLMPGIGLAADPVRGGQLFSTSPRPGVLPCMDCHSENPQVNNYGFIWSGRNAVSLIHRAVQSNTGGMGVFLNLYSFDDLADIAAYLGNSPASLSFSSTEIGATSTPQRVSISSSIKQGLKGLRWSASGDFHVVSTNCREALEPFETCTVDVAFRPAEPGLRQGALSIDHSDTPSPVRLALSGQGAPRAQAVAALRPAAISFGGGAGTRRSAVLSNHSAVTLRVLSVRSSHAAFGVIGGSCVQGLELAPGESCRIALRLEASGVVASPSVLEVVHDGEEGVSRTELTAEIAASQPPAFLQGFNDGLRFGVQAPGSRSPAQRLTLRGGTGGLEWHSMEVTDPSFTLEGTSCRLPQRLEPGRSCHVSLNFGSERAGHYSGELRLRSAGGVTVWRAPLEGTVGRPGLRMSRDRLSWQGVVSRTQWQDLVVVNLSDEGSTLPASSIAGVHAGDFALADSGCRAGETLPPGGSCVVRLAFTPQAAGSRNATLRLGDLSADLAGLAAPQAFPIAWVDRTWIDFSWRPPGAVSAGETLVLTNRGSAPLAWRSVAMTGDGSASFTQDGDCLTGGALAPGASCRLELRHAPSQAGRHDATVVLWPAGSTEPLLVRLTGEGRSMSGAVLEPDQPAVDFGRAPQGAGMPTRRVSVRNLGGAVLPSPVATVSGPFEVVRDAGSCPATLAPGQSCAFEVAMSTATLGDATGQLAIRSENAPPVDVPLAGRIDPDGPLLAWAQGLVPPDFGMSPVGSVSSPAEWTLVNRGRAASEALRWRIDGADAQDFSVAAGSTCLQGRSLAPGATCRIQLQFNPSAPGARHARLHWVGTTGPGELALNGRGQDGGYSQLRTSPQAVTFQARPAATPWPQLVVVAQEGARMTPLQVAPLGPTPFLSRADPASPCVGEEPMLLPGETCRFELTWDGSAAGRSPAAWFMGSTDGLDLVTVPLRVAEDPSLRSNVGAGVVSAMWLLLLCMAVAVLRPDRQESSHG